MKYTIKVNEVNKESNIKTMATVVFDDSFKVGSIAVVERNDGELFVAMPQFRSSSKDKYGNDVYKSVCNPITKEFRQELFDNILDTYQSEQKERTLETRDGKALQFKVSVVPFERAGSNMKGIGRIYFNDCFVVNNVSILQGKEDLFVSMPSYKTKQTDEQGKAVYQDVCYPVTKEFREVLYGEMIDAYHTAMDRTASKGDDFMVPEDTELPIMEQGARQDKIASHSKKRYSLPWGSGYRFQSFMQFYPLIIIDWTNIKSCSNYIDTMYAKIHQGSNIIMH